MLDYTLQNSSERLQFVRNYLESKPESVLEAEQWFARNASTTNSNRFLETLANYILYSKDLKTKEIDIEPAKNTYRRKSPESLDALMDNPAFDENRFLPADFNTYTKPKPRIHDSDSELPGMADLQHTIRGLQAKIDNGEYKGKDLWRAKHILVDLRREQYALRDIHIKTIVFKRFTPPQYVRPELDVQSGYVREVVNLDGSAANKNSTPTSSSLGEQNTPPEQNMLPAGDMVGTDWEWVEVGHAVDLTNPLHIYHLLERYSSLKESVYDDTDAPLRYLLYTLEEIVEKAELSPDRKYILIRKVDRATNEQIRQELIDKMDKSFNVNYISTIFKREICNAIANTAKLEEDKWRARNQPERWKVCSTCKIKKLADPREFVRRKDSADGLSARCKKCDKKKRDQKKMQNT
jgi:hypothetical protein